MGEKRKSPSLPPARAEAQGDGGNNKEAIEPRHLQLQERLRQIQLQVSTLQKLSSPAPSPKVADEEPSRPPSSSAPSRPPSSSAPSAPPSSSARSPDLASSAEAYTDYSSVPEPCTLEEVLAANAEHAATPERREANEAGIRRRGGAPDNNKDSGAGGGGGGGGRGSNGAKRGGCSHATFPARLHDILSRPDLADVIEWLPHGRSWRIVDQAEFINRVMPHYFAQSKIASFMRQVNGWGFVRVTRGKEANSYYSEFFLRGKRSLVRFMERKPAMRDLMSPEPNLAGFGALPPNPEVDVSTLMPLPPTVPRGMAAMAYPKGRKKKKKGGVAYEAAGGWVTVAALPMQVPPALVASADFQRAVLQAQLSAQQQPHPSQPLLQQPPQNAPVQQMPFPAAVPQAFPQEMPTQAPGGTMPQMMMMKPNSQIVPNPQGSMGAQVFQGVQQLPPSPKRIKIEADGAQLPNAVSPSPQFSSVLSPQDIGSASNLVMPKLVQQVSGGSNGDINAAGMLSGDTNPQWHLQQQQQQGHFKMQENPPELAGLMQQEQLRTNYQWMHPSPFPKNTNKSVPEGVAQASQTQLQAQPFTKSVAASDKSFSLADPLDADPFAGDDLAALEMNDVDVTGMVPMTVPAIGDEGFMGGNLDDIW